MYLCIWYKEWNGTSVRMTLADAFGTSGYGWEVTEQVRYSSILYQFGCPHVVLSDYQVWLRQICPDRMKIYCTLHPAVMVYPSWPIHLTDNNNEAHPLITALKLYMGNCFVSEHYNNPCLTIWLCLSTWQWVTILTTS